MKKKPVAKAPKAGKASGKGTAKKATKPAGKPASKAVPKKTVKAPSKAAARKPVKTTAKAPAKSTPAAKHLKPESKKAMTKQAEKSTNSRAGAAGAAAGVHKPEQRYAGLIASELIKAPASQYMNAAQLAYFREMLLSMQRELIEKADLTSEHLREHDIEPDPTDQATIEEEYALELRARDRERKLLKKIEQALRRIEDGSYGYCEETGEAIGIPRLLARPTATLTIEAQSRRELKQKLYGD